MKLLLFSQKIFIFVALLAQNIKKRQNESSRGIRQFEKKIS